MTGSAALDILIGLFTLYFVMSTLCSALVEIISDLLALRSKMLRTFLEHQFPKTPLQRDANSAPKSNIDQFYEIQNAASPRIVEIIRLKQKLLPSIKSANFAQAVNILIGLGNDISADKPKLIQIVQDLPASRIRDALTNAIQQSDETLKDVSDQLANWFDGEMERLSEIYKRRTQLFLFIVGIVVSLWLNVDTIAIANALAKNPALRDAVVEQAKSITQSTPANANQPPDPATLDANKAEWQKALNQLGELGLPIGWDNQCGNDTTVTDQMPIPDTRPCSDISEAGRSLPGILITAAAVALGAPFWFDLLKSLTSSSSDSKEKDGKQK